MWYSALGEGTSVMGVPRPGSGRRVQTANARLPVWVGWSGGALSAEGEMGAKGRTHSPLKGESCIGTGGVTSEVAALLVVLPRAAASLPTCGRRGQLG